MVTAAESAAEKTRKTKIEEVISRLSNLQAATPRDYDAERLIAQGANEKLLQGVNHVRVEVRVRSGFSAQYYPPKLISEIPPLQQIAIRQFGSLDAAAQLQKRLETQVDSRLFGFFLGPDLGYSHKLENEWYMLFIDSPECFSAPIDGVEAVIRISL